MSRFILCILFAVTVGCQDLGGPSGDDIVDFTGTISENTAGDFVIHSDTSFYNTSTFYPTNLPESCKHDGLRIRFSGKIDASPAAMYLYLPLKISEIEILQR